MSGISEACNDLGYFLLVSMVKAEQAAALCRRLVRGRQCDGLIMLASDVDTTLLARLVEDAVPLVLIGRHPRFPWLSSVNAENAEGARLAVAHLVALGHRRVATITGRPGDLPGAERRDGYEAALRAAGLPVAPELVAEGDLAAPSGDAAMRACSRCRTARPRSSRPTTRWPPARCGPSARPASACPATSPWSASTTRRSPP